MAGRGLEVTFRLGERDLAHFRRIIERLSVEQDVPEPAPASLAEIAARVRAAEAPDYVLERLATLESIEAMTRDPDWKLPERARAPIRAAIRYLTEPDDLIPDHLPGLGFLDDAIMIELVARELAPELEAYAQFCSFRGGLAAGPERAARLEARRAALRAGLERRSKRGPGLF